MAGNHRFIARGVTDYVMPFYADGNSPDPHLAAATAANYAERWTAFRAMQSAGINVVRIPLGLPGFVSDIYGLGGTNGYLRRLRLTVQAAQSVGLRVILCWWDSLGWAGSLPRQYQSDWTMMASVIRAIGPNPDVIYEPFNEPNGLDWASWQQVVISTLREWRTHLGYQGPLILDTIDYSWTFSASAATAVQAADSQLLGGPPQLVFANHRYPNGSDCLCGSSLNKFEATIGRWVSKFPLIGTEYGVYSAGYPASDRWMATMLTEVHILDGRGFNGAAVFTWYWIDPNTLTTAPPGPLTTYGRLAQGYLWQLTG